MVIGPICVIAMFQGVSPDAVALRASERFESVHPPRLVDEQGNARPGPTTDGRSEDSFSTQEPRNLEVYLQTLATISGATAAILGGFVLSALLSLSSEKRSLQARLAERSEALERIRATHGRASKAADQLLDGLLMDWVRARFRDAPEAVLLQDLDQDLRRLGLTEAAQAATAHAEEYIGQRNVARQIVQQDESLITSDSRFRSFERWEVLRESGGVSRDVLRDEFDRLVASIDRRETLGRTIVPGSLAGLELRADGDRLSDAVGALARWSASRPNSEEVRLADELSRLESTVDELGAQVKALRAPGRLGIGLALFVVMIFGGVLYPIALMLSDDASLAVRHKVPVFAALAIELVGITVYMISVARDLNRA